MNKTATVLVESAELLLKSMQQTLEDAGAAIIRPARAERGGLLDDEQREIAKLQQIQNKLREVQYLFGDLK